MNKLDQCIEQAEKLSANEVLISGLRAPSFKVGGRWRISGSDFKIEPAELRGLLLKCLSDSQKERLLESEEIQFSLSLNHGLRNVRVVQAQQGLLVHISWEVKSEISRIQVPELAQQVLREGRGVYLVTGAMDSGRAAALESLVNDFAKDKTVFVFNDNGRKFNFSSDFIWSFSTDVIDSPIVSDVVPDLVVIDSNRPSLQRFAVEFAEMGYRVLLSINAADGVAGLERLVDHIDLQRPTALRRLGQVFQMLLSVKLVPAIDEPAVPIFDLLLGTDDVREMIRNDQFSQLEGRKRNSFNQSILSHVLRRKIDLKVGFSESPRPTELDSMLKKVGI